MYISKAERIPVSKCGVPPNPRPVFPHYTYVFPVFPLLRATDRTARGRELCPSAGDEGVIALNEGKY